MHGPDWYIDQKGNLKVNYGGHKELNWEDWQEKFCWLPGRIIIKVMTDDEPYRPFWKVYKWVWWRTIYSRRRIILHFPETKYEYEYAEDLFDLIKQESK